MSNKISSIKSLLRENCTKMSYGHFSQKACNRQRLKLVCSIFVKNAVAAPCINHFYYLKTARRTGNTKFAVCAEISLEFQGSLTLSQNSSFLSKILNSMTKHWNDRRKGGRTNLKHYSPPKRSLNGLDLFFKDGSLRSALNLVCFMSVKCTLTNSVDSDQRA